MDEIVYRDNNSRFLTSEEVDQNFDFLSRSLRVPVIATVADIVATKFASSFSSIYVAQYSATSGAKSGAHYVRVAAQPAHALAFQDALGQWWEIDVADIWAEQAGECWRRNVTSICTRRRAMPPY